MEEPENIVKILEEYFQLSSSLNSKKILITAGPTYERIDPVRFIGNFSSGKMGFALAEECASRGAEVILVCGPTPLSISNKLIRRIDVESAQQMYEVCLKVFSEVDAAILSAAVADYRPEHTYGQKMKRSDHENLTITLTPNPDIAAALGKIKKPNQLLVGFALETNDEYKNALSKMEKKNFDFIILNSLNEEGAGFGLDTNKITIFSRNGNKKSFELKLKKELAKDILNHVFG
jgi:phosphopantothenoylcysteine decarboxylase/phosphopantothenate--cysteine ligase